MHISIKPCMQLAVNYLLSTIEGRPSHYRERTKVEHSGKRTDTSTHPQLGRLHITGARRDREAEAKGGESHLGARTGGQ